MLTNIKYILYVKTIKNDFYLFLIIISIYPKIVLIIRNNYANRANKILNFIIIYESSQYIDIDLLLCYIKVICYCIKEI